MLGKKTLLALMAVLALCLLIQDASSSAVRHYGNLQAKSRREALALARNIIRQAAYGDDWDDMIKRNGGTADSLYNLPDLEEVGRR